MESCQIRFAERKDVPVILGFIRKLAEYEKLENEVVATEKLLETWLFDKKKAEVLLAFEGEKPVGYALFSITFRRSSVAPASIWKTSLCCRKCAGKVTEKPFCHA